MKKYVYYVFVLIQSQMNTRYSNMVFNSEKEMDEDILTNQIPNYYKQRFGLRHSEVYVQNFVLIRTENVIDMIKGEDYEIIRD